MMNRHVQLPPVVSRAVVSRILRGGALAVAMAAASPVFAHPGHDIATVSASLWSGLSHPFAGMDHLLAMLGVGVWSALGARSAGDAMRPPLAFIVLMLVGAAMGFGGVAMPAVEPMIAASLLVIGLLLAVRARLPVAAGMALVGAFAIFHGFAHGAELPASADALPGVLAYAGGFVLATFALHVAGIGIGAALRERNGWLARTAGAGVALYGAALLIG
jgi:urease accessory protein